MRATDHVDFRSDLTCKWKQFPGGAGAFLLLDPASDDPIVKTYLAGDSSNDYMLDSLRDVTDGPGSVIDLGCHVGTFALGALAMGHEVLAVDANPFHVFLVEHAARLNGFTRARTRWNAVSAAPGTVRFRRQGLFGAIDFDGSDPASIDVPSVRLDDLAAEFARPVRFLKMDVEGAEYDVLSGGESLLRDDGPVVLFESNPPTLEMAGRSTAELRTAFETFGYRVFRPEGDRWIYTPPEEIQPEAWVDMIALNERHQARWSSRIDWHWPIGSIVQKCAFWAALPFPNTKLHLLRELAARGSGAGSPEEMRRIAEDLRHALGHEAPPT